MSQREVVLNATWNGVVAVPGSALGDLIQRAGMSHEESLEWTHRYVRKVSVEDVGPWIPRCPRHPSVIRVNCPCQSSAELREAGLL